MSEVHVIVRARLKAGVWHRFLSVVPGFVDATRREAGCLDYDLYVSATDTGALVTVERWESMAAIERHMATPHTRAFLALAAECLQGAPDFAWLAPLPASAVGGAEARSAAPAQ